MMVMMVVVMMIMIMILMTMLTIMVLTSPIPDVYTLLIAHRRVSNAHVDVAK